MNQAMKSLKKISILLYTVIILFPLISYSQTAKPPLLKFEDLQKHTPKHNTFRIEAVVFDIYKCPPCPPGAMCKPCIPNNLTVVDRINEKDYGSMKRLRIFTEQTDKFVLKRKYIFTVKVKAKLAEGAPITEVELVSFEKLK